MRVYGRLRYGLDKHDLCGQLVLCKVERQRAAHCLLVQRDPWLTHNERFGELSGAIVGYPDYSGISYLGDLK